MIQPNAQVCRRLAGASLECNTPLREPSRPALPHPPASCQPSRVDLPSSTPPAPHCRPRRPSAARRFYTTSRDTRSRPRSVAMGPILSRLIPCLIAPFRIGIGPTVLLASCRKRVAPCYSMVTYGSVITCSLFVIQRNSVLVFVRFYSKFQSEIVGQGVDRGSIMNWSSGVESES